MARKPPLAVIFVLVGIAHLGMPTAYAADPGFCRQYTKAALTQVHRGLENPGCARRHAGRQVVTEFSVHYEWCLGASIGAAGAERDARTRDLRACASR